MYDSIDAVREMFRAVVKKSMQTSYARRYPAKETVSTFETVRANLRTMVQHNPGNSEAWRLLSQVEECLLNYVEAIRCLEQAMSLGNARDRKDMKHLALLRSSQAEWASLRLSPAQLMSLGEFLVQAGVEKGAQHRSLELTRYWLETNGIVNPEEVIAALETRGAFTDFQVLYNVVRG